MFFIKIAWVPKLLTRFFDLRGSKKYISKHFYNVNKYQTLSSNLIYICINYLLT